MLKALKGLREEEGFATVIVEHRLRQVQPHVDRVLVMREGRHTTYDGLRAMLSPRVLGRTDMFVLELWRTYPNGLRAEGLAVAEELLRQRARPLVLSPLAFGNEVAVPWYWDVASTDSLASRCERVLGIARGGWRDERGEMAKIRSLLGAWLAKPQGHEGETGG